MNIAAEYSAECDRHFSSKLPHPNKVCDSLWDTWMQDYCTCVATCTLDCGACSITDNMRDSHCRTVQKKQERVMDKSSQRRIYEEEMDKHNKSHSSSADVECKNLWKKFMLLHCMCVSKPCSSSCSYCQYTMSKPYCVAPNGENKPVDKPVRVTAYKVLDSNFRSTYQSYPWPTPVKSSVTHVNPKFDSPKEPGPWLEIEGTPVLCGRGFHGWLTKEAAFRHLKNQGIETVGHVYEMEIEGKTAQDHEKICGLRARLVREVFKSETPWEEFVAKTDSAYDIVLEANRLRKDATANYINLPDTKPGTTYHPVVPAFHGDFKPYADGTHPGRCGTCGLSSELHDGWEARELIAEKLKKFDMWELILYIQQIQNGKKA